MLDRYFNDYSVSIGKIGKFECDFILRKGNFNYSYLQICMTMIENKETENREYRPLEMIKDNYPKYVLSLDEFDMSMNGIKHKNIRDFLLDDTWG